MRFAHSIRVPVLALLLNILICPAVHALTVQENLAPEIQAIIKRGELRVAMYYRDTPPFYFVDKNGELTGVDVHLIRGFARSLGIPVKFYREVKTFKKIVDQVVNHEVDLAISKLSMTFDRAVRVRYSKPYVTLHHSLLINRIKLEEMAKKRHHHYVIQNLTGNLGVIRNSAYEKFAKKYFKGTNVIGYQTWEEVVDAIKIKKSELIAAYRDEVEIKKIIKDDPNATLRFMTVILKDKPDPKGILLPWDSTHLLSLVNLYLDRYQFDLNANRVLYDYNDVICQIAKKTGQPVSQDCEILLSKE